MLSRICNRAALGALAASLLVASGACDLNKKTPTTPDPPATNAVNYTAIGASDASGYGSSVPCVPFTDCPDGTGYVQTVARDFKTAGKTVTLLNLGVPGTVLSPETEAIGNQVGLGIISNFLVGQLPFVQVDATLVTVFAGGNDANAIGKGIKAGLAGTDAPSYVPNQITKFGKDMQTLVTGIKSRAPYAKIVILNLPNLAALPYAAGLSSPEKQVLQQIADGFSAQTNQLAGSGVMVVDVMCDANFYQPGFYSGDGFHPNDAGYARLASLIYAAASTGSTPTPKTSCTQMTLF